MPWKLGSSRWRKKSSHAQIRSFELERGKSLALKSGVSNEGDEKGKGGKGNQQGSESARSFIYRRINNIDGVGNDQTKKCESRVEPRIPQMEFKPLQMKDKETAHSSA